MKGEIDESSIFGATACCYWRGGEGMPGICRPIADRMIRNATKNLIDEKTKRFLLVFSVNAW